MMRTWLVPVLPAMIIVGSTMRERAAVPPWGTAYMPSRTDFRLRSETASGGAGSTGTSTPSILRTRRGFTAVPLATRATITASCKGEARVKPWPMP